MKNLIKKMKAKKYFDKEYGNNYIKDVVDLKDLESLYVIMQEYADEQLRLHIVSKSLPIRKYEIDFGGNVLAGIEITNNEPIVLGAMNGWGNGISKDEITITEKIRLCCLTHY